MQENDFEKQVHKKMGELRLSPSEAVWEQVEMRLHRKEKRRRWIIWFPLLMAGLALGSYFTLYNSGINSNKKQLTAIDQKSAQRKTAIGNNNNNIDSAESMKTLSENSDKKTAGGGESNLGKVKVAGTVTHQLNDLVARAKVTTKTENTAVTRQNINGKEKISAVAIPVTNNKSKLFIEKNLRGKSSNHVSSRRLPNSSLRKETPYGLVASKYVDESGTSSTSIIKASDSTTNDLSIDVPEQLQSSVVGDAALAAGSINTSLIPFKEDQPLKISKTVHGINKKWEWGFSFAGGRSFYTNGLLNNLFSEQKSLVSFSNPTSSLNQNMSANPGIPNYVEPYPTRASAAFSAGAFIKRNLSRTFAFSVGVNYTLYSTSIPVGKKVDSAFISNIAGNSQTFDRYFQAASTTGNGTTSDYINRYHYLEVPITLQTKLTRKWSRPLYWDLGISASRLIASNALHFDKTTGFYFRNNDLLRKTQFSLITGLPVTISSRKRFGLQVGPQLQYGFNNVLINESSSGKHFLFFGLKANVVFGK